MVLEKLYFVVVQPWQLTTISSRVMETGIELLFSLASMPMKMEIDINDNGNEFQCTSSKPTLMSKDTEIYKLELTMWMEECMLRKKDVQDLKVYKANVCALVLQHCLTNIQ